MTRWSPGPEKCPAASQETPEFAWCVPVWRSRDLPVASCPDTRQPIVFARRHQRCAALRARRHNHSQSAPCASVCSDTRQRVSNVCLITVIVVRRGWETGLRRFDVWLNQRFGSSVSARPKLHFHQKINLWRQFLWNQLGKSLISQGKRLNDFRLRLFDELLIRLHNRWSEEALSNLFLLDLKRRFPSDAFLFD